MDKPLIIYIAGYGRSGSTVLDIALGATCRNSVSLGEVIGLTRSGKRNRIGCSCGRQYRKCFVWSDCLHSVKFKKKDWDAISRRDCILPIGRASKEVYAKFWKCVLQSRLQFSGQKTKDGLVDQKDIAIDSSKTTVNTALRPKNLVELDVGDVFVVHVKRSLKGILGSRSRGRNVELASFEGGARVSVTEKVFGLIWLIIVPLHVFVANYFAARLKKLDIYAGHVEVRFDDIIRNPETVAIKIWEQVSAATRREVIIQSPLSSRVKPDHLVEGNRLLKDVRGVQVRPEEAFPKSGME